MILPREAHTTTISDHRTFGIWYDSQYDLHLVSWQGALSEDAEQTKHMHVSELPKERTETRLSHSSEPRIIAALIGFLRRAGISTQTQQTILLEPYHLLPEAHSSSRHHDYELLAKGLEATSFDVALFDWQAMDAPIPAEPGPLRQYGGTGFYTTKHDDEMQLIFASIAPDHREPVDKNAAIRLSIADVQPVASLICRTITDTPHGHDIAHMLQLEFPSFTE